MFLSCDYTYSGDYSDWTAPVPEDTTSDEEQALDDSIEKYDEYLTDDFSATGIKVRLGLGFYF